MPYAEKRDVRSSGDFRARQSQPVHTEMLLLREVARVYDAMRVDPARGLSIDEAFGDVRARHAARIKAGP